jgi:hypothetical protein
MKSSVGWFGRHLLLVGASFGVIGLSVAWLLWPAETTGLHFTKGQYNEIELGMTRAQVEAIMGIEQGYYFQSASYYEGPIYEETEGDMGAVYQALEAAGETPNGPEQLDWRSDKGSIIVWLINDSVSEKMYTAPESKMHRRFMEAIDLLTGSSDPRPVQVIPRPSSRAVRGRQSTKEGFSHSLIAPLP